MSPPRSPPRSSASAPLSRPFLDAMSLLATSVAIATTDGSAGKAGATVSTLSPVSAESPPSLLICLHHKTSVAQKIQGNKTFAVSILDETQRDIAQLFAGQSQSSQSQSSQSQSSQSQSSQSQSSQSKDKFDLTQHLWQQTHSSAWRLQDALAFFDCQLLQSVRCQSHFVVIGRVLDITLGPSGRKRRKPLIYASRAYTMLSDPPIRTT